MSLSMPELCQRLSQAAPDLDSQPNWPTAQLALCAEAGLYKWFVPKEFGGEGKSEQEILDIYLTLSQNCLTTTFILTQWHAAVRRLVSSDNREAKEQWLPRLARGDAFATVGISHLSTSRQHCGSPALSAEVNAAGKYVLNGFSPWVTGAPAADVLVLGASCDSANQILVAIPTDRLGVKAHPGMHLVALTASCTDQVVLTDVVVHENEIIAGPAPNVMHGNTGGVAGGLQTSTLALGLSLAAVAYLQSQGEQRPDLTPIADKLSFDTQQLVNGLQEITQGTSSLQPGELRQQANLLVLRATQAALQAAKGAGFVAGHPAGRWAREALFFLVWSCPYAVAHANMCELAQLE